MEKTKMYLCILVCFMHFPCQAQSFLGDEIFSGSHNKLQAIKLVSHPLSFEDLYLGTGSSKTCTNFTKGLLDCVSLWISDISNVFISLQWSCTM